jgi:DNA-directed RNA polymerase subunit beta'
MVDTTKFDQLRLGIASPDEIRRWSRGEVKKPETINYRTFRPEPDGLFCERIFGPTRDWECHCGKYRKIKFRGITCDRCGVEVTRSKVRRERMGSIELAAPVCHIWYLKGVPSPLALLLDMSPRPLEKVIYFASYIVTQVDHEKIASGVEEIIAAVRAEQASIDEQVQAAGAQPAGQRKGKGESKDLEGADQPTAEEQESIGATRKAELDTALTVLLGEKLDGKPGLAVGDLISESDHRALLRLHEMLAERCGTKYEGMVRAGLGAEAIREMLQRIDLDALCRELRQEIRETTGPKRARAIKRLEVSEAFRTSKNRPEWMILEVIPVIPPELRPMVQLDGGRFATSDLNDLYRRIINRNNRLKKIRELSAPESIVNHEKRLLQEAVDALIDNGRRARPVVGTNNRPLKSLSDMLKGKEGRFRKNLLGKRVDYSGRSVIVVGPHLKLNQCGLPREMALELFKPFVMKRMVEKGQTSNVKTAKRMVDRADDPVWDALEEVIKDHPVMLNRAPTLHRLGIQAFEPLLVDGKAIQIHPLVCAAFNADFDGDMMAVHVPLSAAAQAEVRILMMSTENLFSPAHGKPLATPAREIVIGIYYLTQERQGAKGTDKVFSSADEAIMAHSSGYVDLHAPVFVRLNGQRSRTTVGRVIFNQCLPGALRMLDRVIDIKQLHRLVAECHRVYGTARTVQLLDDLKELGFHYATVSGTSISTTDMDVPQARREEIIARTEAQVRETNQQYNDGVITAGEREDKVCRLWMAAADQMSDALMQNIDPFNPIWMMVNSGARGNLKQITQLAGMRGLMTDPFGKFIEDLPIKSNFHEGLSVLEYFVSTHGARKGLADTALRTADAGYLTRRLVDVAQDVIVKEDDCGTRNGIRVAAIRDGTEEIEPLTDRIMGRTAAEDIVYPFTGRVLLRVGQEIANETVPPCPSCEEQGELAEIFMCPGCNQQWSAEELVAEMAPFEVSSDEAAAEAEVAPPSESAAVAAAAAEPVEPGAADQGPAEEIPERALLLQQGLCPECRAALVEQFRCTSCKAQFTREQLPSPLAEIEQAVRASEEFLRRAASIRLGSKQAGDLADPFTGRVIVKAGGAVTERVADRIRRLAEQLRAKENLAVGEVLVRSPLTCELRQGICAKCYGRDLATGRLVEVGEAVGVIAAQSIGEPGTQLTMRTFHTGGVAAQYLTGVAEVKKKRQESLRELHQDISKGLVAFEKDANEREKVRKIQQMLKVLEEPVKGLLRVIELFEARRPKGEAIVADLDGTVAEIETKGVKTVLIHSDQPCDERIVGEIAAKAVKDPKSQATLLHAGREITPAVVTKLRQAGLKTAAIVRRHMVPYRGYVRVTKGDVLQRGDRLTDGPLDPQKVLRMKGLHAVQEYLLREIQAVYKSQGVDINDKHIEVIVRQMLKKRRVLDHGDAELLPGQIVDRFQFDAVNERVVSHGGQPATAEPVLLGITEAALTTDSFLSAASFQRTTRVLTEAAIKGKTDNLVGLKENVIIGRLIPAGTGMPCYRNLEVAGPKEEKRLLALPQVPSEEDLLLRAIEEAPVMGPSGMPISATEAEQAALGGATEGEPESAI